MIEFLIAEHALTGSKMVEVWRDGVFIATIYAHQNVLQIVSKYLDGIAHEAANPPAVIIKFSE